MAPEFKSRPLGIDDETWSVIYDLSEASLIAQFTAGQRYLEARQAKDYEAALRSLLDVMKARSRAKRAIALLMRPSQTEGRA